MERGSILRGGRVRMGPKWQSTSKSVLIHSACGRNFGGDTFSLSHIIGPTPLSRPDPVPRTCCFAPNICWSPPTADDLSSCCKLNCKARQERDQRRKGGGSRATDYMRG